MKSRLHGANPKPSPSRIGLATVLILGCATSWGRPAVAAPVWSDPLTGSQLDPDRWTASASSADMALAPSSDGVHMSVAGSAHGEGFSASLGCLCSLEGDFDVQVDYQLDLWPARSGVRTALAVTTPSGFGAIMERDSLSATDVPVQTPASEVYIVDFQPHTGIFPNVPTTDVRGTLRLNRSGGSVTGYFASPGGNWTIVSSGAAPSEPVSMALLMWSGDNVFNKQSGGASVYFRNFAVNSGQLKCPVAGAPDDGADASSTHLVGKKSGGCDCHLASQRKPGAGLLSLLLAALPVAALRRRR